MTTAVQAVQADEVVELRPDDPAADPVPAGVLRWQLGQVHTAPVWSPADGDPRHGVTAGVTVPVTVILSKTEADKLLGPVAAATRGRAVAAVAAIDGLVEQDPRVTEASGRHARLAEQLAEARDGHAKALEARGRAAAAVRAALAAGGDPAGAEGDRDRAAGEASRLAERITTLTSLLGDAEGKLTLAREQARNDALAALRAEYRQRYEAAVRPVAEALLNALGPAWEAAAVIDGAR